jgi:hypothetical protein
MKTRIFIILLFFLFISCKSQNNDFSLFLSGFRSANLPLKIDRSTYGSIFYPNKNYSEIPLSLINKFICLDSTKCDTEPTEFRYDFGVKFEIIGYYATIVHKQKYEGKPDDEFDLSRVILTIYDKNGSIRSQEILGKDNDTWASNINITVDKIYVQQIKILEFIGSEYPCIITVKEYNIKEDGVIKTILSEPVKKGIVSWDKTTGNFILKE